MDIDVHRHSDSRKRRLQSPSRSHHESRHTSKKRRTSNSPSQPSRQHHSHHNRSNKHNHASEPTKPSAPKKPLPFNAHYLHKADYTLYKALFTEYLDLQKQLDLHSLAESEIRGRWKSFRSKWNAGELAEGWYDPVTKARADQRAAEWKSNEGGEVGLSETVEVQRRRVDDEGEVRRGEDRGTYDYEDDEDDEPGPAPPPSATERVRNGPTVPSIQDLQYRREQAFEDAEAEREALRYERKQDREQQRARLDELAPRAEPGTRERQLEKKREAAAVNREFRDARDAGEREVGDGELLGDDGVDVYKQRLRARERQKNEREIRKEEVLRARAAEREERLRVHRAKEDKTMEMLKALAEQRFGGDDRQGG